MDRPCAPLPLAPDVVQDCPLLLAVERIKQYVVDAIGQRSAWICSARACCKRGTQDRKVWQEDVTKDHLIGLYNLDPRHPKSFACELACLLDSSALPTR